MLLHLFVREEGIHERDKSLAVLGRQKNAGDDADALQALYFWNKGSSQSRLQFETVTKCQYLIPPLLKSPRVISPDANGMR